MATVYVLQKLSDKKKDSSYAGMKFMVNLAKNTAYCR